MCASYSNSILPYIKDNFEILSRERLKKDILLNYSEHMIMKAKCDLVCKAAHHDIDISDEKKMRHNSKNRTALQATVDNIINIYQKIAHKMGFSRCYSRTDFHLHSGQHVSVHSTLPLPRPPRLSMRSYSQDHDYEQPYELSHSPTLVEGTRRQMQRSCARDIPQLSSKPQEISDSSVRMSQMQQKTEDLEDQVSELTELIKKLIMKETSPAPSKHFSGDVCEDKSRQH